ncbi:UNVERIFIED_CONTAM: hypothetical protein Sradi_7060000 [Sesamum radiatum]|uniref:DUF4283 domain-containing protein n=1 Tax=Sesamum radiatum TaxID=300843 RepID=A0AAW2J6A1_SESRA
MLSSLSHTSHTTSSSHSHLPADDGVNRGVAAGDSPGGRQPTLNSLEERVRQEFDFPEFYSLASRVLDGDEESLGKLLDLKARWERRFPDHNRARRLFPRFPSKPTFLPRRSIIQPVAELADLADQNDPVPIADDEATPVGNPAQEVQENLPNSQSGPSSANSPVQESEVFIGKVKLAMDKSDCIAEAFLNSSRKTLRYIPPISQNEEIIIKPTPAMVAQGLCHGEWVFLFPIQDDGIHGGGDRRGPLAIPRAAGGPETMGTGDDSATSEASSGSDLDTHTSPSMEYWTEEGLSAVASGIGTPLYSDKITKNCLRLDFARVCVMLDFHSQLPKHLVVLSPILSEGKEVPIKVDIEYEWLPLRCKQCCSLGHTANSCPEVKVVKQRVPVTVYVQKQRTVVSHVTRGPNDDVETTSGQVEPRGVLALLSRPQMLGETWLCPQPHNA